MRQHDEAKRQHPEAEDGQEAEKAAEDQRKADTEAGGFRSRKRNTNGAEDKLVCDVIYSEAPRLSAAVAIGIFFGSALIGHPQEMVRRRNNTREMDFFEKNRLANRESICISPLTPRQAVFPGSSAVEHSTVNRQVAGSESGPGSQF